MLKEHLEQSPGLGAFSQLVQRQEHLCCPRGSAGRQVKMELTLGQSPALMGPSGSSIQGGVEKHVGLFPEKVTGQAT